MTDVISIVSSPISLFIRLRDEIRKYQRKKKTRERLLHALEEEIKGYQDISEEISQTSEQLMPILDSIKDTPTITQLNNLVKVRG